MTQIAVKRTKNRHSELGDPLEPFAESEDINLVDWQIVPQSRHALVVIEYEEVAE